MSQTNTKLNTFCNGLPVNEHLSSHSSLLQMRFTPSVPWSSVWFCPCIILGGFMKSLLNAF